MKVQVSGGPTSVGGAAMVASSYSHFWQVRDMGITRTLRKTWKL